MTKFFFLIRPYFIHYLLLLFLIQFSISKTNNLSVETRYSSLIIHYRETVQLIIIVYIMRIKFNTESISPCLYKCNKARLRSLSKQANSKRSAQVKANALFLEDPPLYIYVRPDWQCYSVKWTPQIFF